MTQPAVLSDYSALLAFENGVFNVDFLKKVPKLYVDPAFSTACHGIIKEEGRITAAIAAYPTAMETDCGVLRAVGIGSVAVDSTARGKGYMRDMLAYCNRVAAEQQADLAFLSGARGRYAHDGYVPCGQRFLFEITTYFLQHFSGDAAFSFAPLADDPRGLAETKALFSAQPLHWVRSDADYLTITTSWEGRGFSVRDKDGAFCGALIYEGGRAFVSELLLRAGDQAAGVLSAFAQWIGADRLIVAAEPTQTELLASLKAFGEHITVEMPAAFKIYRLQHFLEVLGSYKARHFALPEGSLVLKIGDEVLRVTVADGRCTAVPSVETPELVFSAQEGAVCLTTTFGAYVQHPLFAAWAPLCPLGMPHADGV